jgi:hypothetical protein
VSRFSRSGAILPSCEPAGPDAFVAEGELSRQRRISYGLSLEAKQAAIDSGFMANFISIRRRASQRMNELNSCENFERIDMRGTLRSVRRQANCEKKHRPSGGSLWTES